MSERVKAKNNIIQRKSNLFWKSLLFLFWKGLNFMYTINKMIDLFNIIHFPFF